MPWVAQELFVSLAFCNFIFLSLMEILNIQNSPNIKKHKYNIKKKLKHKVIWVQESLWYNWFFARQNSSNEHNGNTN